MLGEHLPSSVSMNAHRCIIAQHNEFGLASSWRAELHYEDALDKKSGFGAIALPMQSMLGHPIINCCDHLAGKIELLRSVLRQRNANYWSRG